MLLGSHGPGALRLVQVRLVEFVAEPCHGGGGGVRVGHKDSDAAQVVEL